MVGLGKTFMPTFWDFATVGLFLSSVGWNGLDVKACFVGVGGRSKSLLDWLSSLPTGDCELSSPSTLKKLPRRCMPPFRMLLPNILTPLPKVPGSGRLA